MKQGYNYKIIKKNYPYLEQESALLENNYNPKKKYAMIGKLVHKDGSESIDTIVYSNDIVALQKRASQFPSWYNYPLGLCKNMQGYITELKQ